MSSVSSYNPMKENVRTTFGSSLSLQSSTARSLTKDIPNVHKTFMKVHSSHCEGAKQLCGSYHVDLCRRWGVGFIQQRRLDLHLARSVAVHFQFYAIILCLFCIFYGLLLLLLLLLLLISPLLVFILFLFLVIPFSTTCNGNRSVELLLSFMKKELGDALR